MSFCQEAPLDKVLISEAKVDGSFYIDARAKINLFLEVLGRRKDGYHDILSVFQEVALADRLYAKPSDSDSITIECDDPTLPVDGSNL
ncbi:MAG: hypothetical protein JXR97_08400, partial [Planctomycetes bacterium]|nr:hypothetical protein [Planctomycetota bacterium]